MRRILHLTKDDKKNIMIKYFGKDENDVRQKQCALAIDYGVSQSTIHLIVKYTALDYYAKIRDLIIKGYSEEDSLDKLGISQHLYRMITHYLRKYSFIKN